MLREKEENFLWNGQKVYTLQQAAALAGLKERSLYMHTYRGQLGKGCFRLTGEDLDTFRERYPTIHKQPQLFLLSEEGIQELLHPATAKPDSLEWRGQTVYTYDLAEKITGIPGSTLRRHTYEKSFLLEGDELAEFKQRYPQWRKAARLFLLPEETLAELLAKPEETEPEEKPVKKDSAYQQYLKLLCAWAAQRPKISIRCYEKKVYARRVLGL